MQVGVIGISHRSSDLTLREEVAKACTHSLYFDYSLPLILLTTCNRTELYFSAEDLAEAHSHLLAWLRSKLSIAFDHKIYSYFGIECFTHLTKVASGLDSVIVAETEIQGQVKRAYSEASKFQSLPSCMHYLFQKTLKIAKQIREHLPPPNSLEKTLLHIANSVFHTMEKKPILFIGNSQINRKILHYFKKRGSENCLICTRSPSSTECVPWETVHTWHKYPLIICGTHQSRYILGPETAPSQLNTRLIFDLSMPRTVDPRLKHHPQILLMNLEDLRPHLSGPETMHARSMHELRSCVEKYYHLFQTKPTSKEFCLIRWES